MNVPLRCRCGRVRGVASDVSRSTGFRFICYCKDCQAFAHFLGRADVLREYNNAVGARDNVCSGRPVRPGFSIFPAERGIRR
jgi:hypothetical protein